MCTNITPTFCTDLKMKPLFLKLISWPISNWKHKISAFCISIFNQNPISDYKSAIYASE